MDWDAIKAALVAIGEEQRQELIGDGVALTTIEHPIGPAVDEDADINEDAVETIEIELPDDDSALEGSPSAGL